MRKKNTILPTVFVLIGFLLIIIFLQASGFLKGPVSFIEKIVSPWQGRVFTASVPLRKDSAIALLQKQLVDQKKLEAENKALRDQFQTTEPSRLELIPAAIVGAPSFIPHVSAPEFFVLDKGEADGVHAKDIVVYKDILVGVIDKVSENRSRVRLIGDKDISFTAQSITSFQNRSEASVSGVIKGQGNLDMVFENVLLSDPLAAGDMIISKGDVDINGNGIVPYLMVGRVISVEKKASNLFQSAKIKSPLDFSNLSLVFVLKTHK